VLPGSHFLPLEFPDMLAACLQALVERADVADRLRPTGAR
jgi:hypothetical protein